MAENQFPPDAYSLMALGARRSPLDMLLAGFAPINAAQLGHSFIMQSLGYPQAPISPSVSVPPIEPSAPPLPNAPGGLLGGLFNNPSGILTPQDVAQFLSKIGREFQGPRPAY